MDDLAEIEKQYLTLREKNKDLLRGMEMPDFTAYTQDGKAYTLSDMKGKVVVIDFWFTGCILPFPWSLWLPPCPGLHLL